MITRSKGARTNRGAPSAAEKADAQGDREGSAQRSAGDRRRAEALLRIVEQGKDRIAERFYDLGEALRELSRRRLHVALGHASFAEMLRARRIMALTQAKKLIDIVSRLSRDAAEPLGPDRAYALARGAPPMPESDAPESDAPESDAPESATAPIRAGKARARAKGRGSKPRPAEERDAMQAARKVQAALRQRGAKDAIATAHKGKGGWWLHVEVRVDAAESLTDE